MFIELQGAVRSLLRAPGFTFTALATLALGIGAVTTVFTLLRAELFAPLPYPGADRLVVPFSVNTQRGIDIPRIGLADFMDWQREKVFDLAAVFEDEGRSVTLEDSAGSPEQVRTIRVSEDYFSVLGIGQAVAGRLLNTDDYRPGNGPAACMLSERLWKRRYGGDTKVIGQRVGHDGGSCLVVGVTPRDALWPANTDVVGALTLMGRPLGALAGSAIPAQFRSNDFLLATGIARLRPDTSLEQVDARLAALAKQTEMAFPRQRGGWSNRVIPLREMMVGKQARALMLMAGVAVCFLMAIAILNVAGLLLTRNIARQQETQVRAALGAGRARLIVQTLAESAVLAVIGGGLGLLLAVTVIGVSGRGEWSGLIARPLAMDWHVFTLVLGAAALTTLLCGLVAQRYALRIGLNPSLGRATAAGARALRGLIVTEIALSVLLAAGAGLMVRSFIEVQRNDPGFQSDHLLTFAVTLRTPAQIPPDGQAQILAIFGDITSRLQSAPGVLSAAVSSGLALGGGGHYFTSYYEVVGREQAQLPVTHPAMVNVVGAGYFNTLGIRRVTGRDFDSSDAPAGNQVVIISESLARAAFPGEDPIGKRIRCSWDARGPREIVGVVQDVRYLGREDELRPVAYAPHSQWTYPAMKLNVRTAGDPAAMIPVIREHLGKAHPNLIVSEPRTMRDILDRSVAPRRAGVMSMSVLAGAALLLTLVGVYVALTCIVTLRVKEIGVRMAQGAQPGEVRGMVIGQGLRLTLAGLVPGLIGALLLARLMAHLLYGITPTDPMTFVVIATAMVAVVAIACYLPARRATRVDPMVALRE